MKSYPIRLVATVAAFLALASIGFAGTASVSKDKPKTTTQPTGKDSKAEVSSETQAILDAIGNQQLGGSARVIRMTGEQINWQVISAGGGSGSSTNYVLIGTVGQTAVGTGTSTNYGIIHGFQQDFAGGGGGCCDQVFPDGMRGDANYEDGVDVSDLTFIVDYLFRGGPEPPCFEEGDVDGSGGIDVADLTYIVDYLFRSGAAPPPCP